MKKSETDQGSPTEMPPRPDRHFALPKKNVGKATKTNKGKDSAVDKDDEETTTVKKAPEVRPENVETNGVAAKGKTGRGKNAGKKNDVVENLVEAVLIAKVVEPETPVPEIEHEESAPVAESKGKKLRGKKVSSKKDFIDLQEHKESENLVAAETDTKEKLCRGKQTSSKEGIEKPAKTTEEQLPNYEIESSLPAVPVVETKEKRGRDKRAVVPGSVSKADSEEEAVEEVTKAKGKKRVKVAKKQVKVEKKSAVIEDVAAPAEVMETIESPESVPAKKSRGKKDAIEEAVVRAEPEVPEDEKEIKKGRSKRPSKKATNEETQEEVVENNHPVEAEAPIAEIKGKKERGKKVQPPAKAEEINCLHEDIPEPVAEEKAVEVTAGPKPKTGPKSKVGLKSRMEIKPTEEEDKSPSVAEPEVAEKKGPGKKAHPSAYSASQAAPEVDTPDEMDGPSSSGGDVASFIDDRVRQRQQTRSSEKTLVGAFIEIDTLADQFELPEGTVAIAKQLFEAVKEGQHSKGFRTHTVATTCLYIAARQKGDLRTIDETCAVSKIGIKEFRACFQRIRTALNITLAIITTSDFIPRFCFNLGLPNNVQIAASHIGRKAVELDIVPGRCPTSVAATAIYMACHASDNKLTKKELCDVTGVTDSTIRQLYKLMYPRVIELFPGDFKLILDKLPPS